MNPRNHFFYLGRTRSSHAADILPALRRLREDIRRGVPVERQACFDFANVTLDSNDLAGAGSRPKPAVSAPQVAPAMARRQGEAARLRHGYGAARPVDPTGEEVAA